MRLIVSSKEDTASQNILNNLLEYDWETTGRWRGNPIYQKENDRIATVNQHHIYAEGIDKELSEILGSIDHMVFISKHASKAGIHSLTVHPIGNFGKAKFGGKDRGIVPPAPHQMTTALRVLYNEVVYHGLTHEYEVSFEATHHGPYLETPTYYIEIGSDNKCWTDKRAGEVIAKTLIEIKTSGENSKPIIFCIGGGHYTPEFTDTARHKAVSIGHIVPGWALKDVDEEMFNQGLEQSKADNVMISKEVQNDLRDKIDRWCVQKGVKIVDDSDLNNI